jgi:hypothetical protein
LKFTQSDFKTVTSNISFISNHKRVVTRTILIPFAEPSIGPTDEEGDEVFAEMEDLVQQRLFSKSIGWIIELGARLVEEKTEIDASKAQWSVYIKFQTITSILLY